MIRVVFALCALVMSSALLAQTLPDPTKPKQVVGEGELDAQGLDAQGFPSVNVSAVFITAESKRAIVNGESVTVGALYKGLQVVEIHNNGVVLANAQQEKEFLVNNNTFIKDASNDF